MLLCGQISVPGKCNLKIRETVYLVILHMDVAAVGMHTNETNMSKKLKWKAGDAGKNLS